MKLIQNILLFFLILSLGACSATKGIGDDEKLYTGASIKYKDPENLSSKRTISDNILLNLPKKNSPGILNLKTYFYNIYDSTSSSGFKHTIKYKIGSKPVVYQSEYLDVVPKRLKKITTDFGYLNSSVECDTVIKKRKVGINCLVELGERYVIDTVTYLEDTLPVSKVLIPMVNSGFLKSGDYYLRDKIIEERTAFVKIANDNGYPYISQEDVLFYVDTTKQGNKVDIHLRLRPPTDSIKYERHRFGKIFINPNFLLDEDQVVDTSDMIQMENYSILEGYDFLRNDAFEDAIFIKQGKIYNTHYSKLTMDRMLDFGLFKFVNLKNVRNSDNTIDQYFNLTTSLMQSITGELELNNRSGNFFGLAGRTTYTHKNLFGGAERFDATLSGGLETQFGVGESLINTSDITLETSITMPTVKLPIFDFQTNKNYIPKTFISLSANLQNRIEFYRISSLKAKYGFKWNETHTKAHFLSPIDVNWLVLSNTTAKFDSIRMEDPRIDQSLSNILIIGGSYDFIYNKQNKYNPNNQTFFKGSVEAAGNLLNLFVNPQANQTQAEIFGTPFAQFLRLTMDGRRYIPFGDGLIASRIMLGMGYAYGNSDELPYSRQYSIGGSNSLRAYRLRRLGPGGYLPVDPENDAGQFLDQTGDIKFEANLEYRFPIIGFLKGAFFFDAGNVWTFASVDRPEGAFAFDQFYNQIAVGTGLGVRFDFNFFVFRLDLAFPIRDIKSTNNFDWTLSEIDFFSSTWRNEKLIYNLGIGYPF